MVSGLYEIFMLGRKRGSSLQNGDCWVLYIREKKSLRSRFWNSQIQTV